MLVDSLTHALLTMSHDALREWRAGPFSFAYQWDVNNLLLRDKAPPPPSIYRPSPLSLLLPIFFFSAQMKWTNTKSMF